MKPIPLTYDRVNPVQRGNIYLGEKDHVEGFFMYFRPEQILEQYEIEIRSVSKGRDCYLCETNLGGKALKEYRGSRERAEFLAGMLEFLSRQKLLVETVIRTKEGEPLASEEEEQQKYILVDAFRGAECDTKSREDIICAAGLLASLHNASKAYQGEVPEFVKNRADVLYLLYEKHNRELKQVRRYIRSGKKRNEFEELFLRSYDSFFEKAAKVTELLKGRMPSEELTGFCHGDYNQHNVIFSREGTAIVNFGNYSYGVMAGDLANFIRKMMEKNNWNPGLAMDIIRAYDVKRKLKEEEFLYLFFYLAYPEKFWKIANHYSQSHKPWLSMRDFEKLERVIAQEHEREQFLNLLYHMVAV